MTFDNNQIQTRDKWYFLFQPLYLKLDVNFPTPQAPLPHQPSDARDSSVLKSTFLGVGWG